MFTIMARKNLSKIPFLVLVLFGLNGISLFPQAAAVDDVAFGGNRDISDGKLRKVIRTRTDSWYRSLAFWKEQERFQDLFRLIGRGSWSQDRASR